MKRFFRIALVSLAAATLMSGCSMMAPKYTASLDNIQTLKNTGNFTAKVGEFTSTTTKENANPISIRANPMSSPYENSYGKYLAEALKQELALANKISDNAEIEISGALIKNDIDATGFSVATGEIGARFVVKKGDKTLYDQVKTTSHEWPSSFVGAIAIPRAVEEYPNLVQKLLALVYADQAFVDAVK